VRAGLLVAPFFPILGLRRDGGEKRPNGAS